MKSVMSAIPNYVMQGEATYARNWIRSIGISYGGQLERRKNFIWLGGVK